MVKRVNFYGGPGTGKSTMATYAFSRMKMLNLNVEFAHEFVKLWAYERRNITAEDQCTIFNEQLRHELVPLKAGVDLVITDSPVNLVSLYSKKVLTHETWLAMQFKMREHEQNYKSLNIFLERSSTKPYQEKGRWQTKEEAIRIDIAVKEMLIESNLSFVSLNAHHYDEVVNFILAEIR